MKASDVANLIKPFVLRWIEQAQAQARGGAPSPHDLASSHHTGSLADSQAPQFLKLDGSRALLGSLTVADGATIDGVDLSAHADDPAAHHTPFVGLLDGFGSPTTLDNEHVTLAGSGPHLSTTSAGATLFLELDDTSTPGASSRLLSTDSTGKIQLTGLTLTGDLAINGGKLTSTGDLVLDLVGKDVLPNVGYDLNIGARLKPFLSAHIAELQVGTLVAREEIATVGGSLFVAPTNILAADLPASGTPTSTSAPSRQALSTYSSGGTSSTVAVQVPAAAALGNLAIVPVVFRSNTIGVTSAPAGWDHRGTFPHAASGQTIAIYSRELTSADVTTVPRPTYSWTLGSAVASLGAMVCLKDFNTSNPFDIDVVWKQGTSGTNVVADSQTTTQNNTYYLFFGVSAANCTFTHPGGMNEVLDIATSAAASNIALNIAEETRATAGPSGSRTAVASVSANNMSVVLAIAPVATGVFTSPISVKYNNFLVGDTLVMKENGVIEFMRVLSAASGSGPYTYTVTRDLDGTGLNAWVAGDAVLNTLQAGKGWLEMYAEYSTKSSSQEGPTIVANVRNSSTYNDWTPRAAFGRLKNLYDYSSGADPYGVAFGNPSATWLGIDDTNGFRIMNATTRIAQWEADGDIKLGPTNALQLNADGSAAFSGSITFGGGTHVGDATGLNVYATGTTNIYRAHDNTGNAAGVIVRDTMIMPGTVAGTIRRISEVNTGSASASGAYNRAEFQLSAGRGNTTDSYLLLGTQGVGATLMSTERLSLASYNRTGYIHVPLPTPATSANWSSTNKAIIGWTTINLASEFGIPSQVRGVFVRLVGTATATGTHDLSLSGNASNAALSLRAYSTTVPDDESGFVPTDNSGNISYIVRGTAFNGCSLIVTGYLI